MSWEDINKKYNGRFKIKIENLKYSTNDTHIFIYDSKCNNNIIYVLPKIKMITQYKAIWEDVNKKITIYLRTDKINELGL